jgi:hypothetical protein
MLILMFLQGDIPFIQADTEEYTVWYSDLFMVILNFRHSNTEFYTAYTKDLTGQK